MTGRALSTLAVLAGLSGANVARAERACDGEQPWVRIQLRAPAWSSAQRERVLSNLEHTLAAQGIDACPDEKAPQNEALAALRIDIDPESRVTVEIEVRDAVTHKRVGRDVDLRPIPDDGRELAVAIEADELLRASWAELALDTERARAAKPRRQVVESVGRVLAPARVRSSSTLGARAAGEYYTKEGTALLGADALGSLRLGQLTALELAIGMRTSPAVSAEHGSVRALAFGAGARLLLRLAGGEAAALDAGAGLSGNWLNFRAEPDAPATGEPYSDWLLVARGGLLFHLGLGSRLELSAGLSGGGAVRGVEATDAGRVVAGASGLELGATLGLGAR